MDDETQHRRSTDASPDVSADTSPTQQATRRDASTDASRLTIAEAARRLNTTETAVRMRIRRGTLPSEKDASGRLHVLLADASTDTSADTSPTQQATRRDTSTDTSADLGVGEPIDAAYRVDGEAPGPPTALVPLSTMLEELGHFAERIEALALEVGALRSDLAHVTTERDELRRRAESVEAERDALRERVAALEASQAAAEAPQSAPAASHDLGAVSAAADAPEGRERPWWAFWRR